jgi:hopene-associated glycosyltransferase HpnB
METALFLTGSLSLLTWLYLVFLHGRFWRADQQLDYGRSEPGHWPDVAILIATRDDAEAIEETLPDLLEQAYPGHFHIILVDDHSRDGTVEAASRAAQVAGATERLSVVTVGARPAGWSRRAWALAQAQEHAAANLPAVRYSWLTEPWIQHGRRSLQDLVAKAEGDRCGLVSLLPLSTCETAWDRLLSPAFAFFFQAFHPLPRVNDSRHAAAAASPGCVLVDTNVLTAAGGFAALKDAAVLESALAAKVKAMARRNGHGIWLGLGEDSTSVRSGHGWRFLRDLTFSTAEAQLSASPMRLAAGTIVMALACLAPPVVFLWALIAGFFLDIDQFLITYLALLFAGAAWAGMCFAAWPTLELYEQEEWRTVLLPLAALTYILLTMALLPKLLGTARPHAKIPAATTKAAARPRSGEGKVEPHMEIPSQPTEETSTGHALRRRITRP